MIVQLTHVRILFSCDCDKSRRLLRFLYGTNAPPRVPADKARACSPAGPRSPGPAGLGGRGARLSGSAWRIKHSGHDQVVAVGLAEPVPHLVSGERAVCHGSTVGVAVVAVRPRVLVDLVLFALVQLSSGRGRGGEAARRTQRRLLVGSMAGKKPLTVPSLIRVTARLRSNFLPWWTSSAMISAMPITARAEMSGDSNGKP
jgi:hypothetical protein